MLLQAAREHDLDLQESFMAATNWLILRLERARCNSFLVLTGYGAKAAVKPEAATVQKCLDLGCAARLIIENMKGVDVL
jgi:hypothetical protein